MVTTPDPVPDEPEAAVRDGDPLRGDPSRLHPSAVAVWTLEAIYALILIIITGGTLPILGAAMMVGIVGLNALRYFRFRWRLDPDSLVIEQGLLRRHRRVIPRDRVQTVDLEIRLRHRLFGVVEVRVEALGGGATEGKLAALNPATAEALRRTLLPGPARPVDSTPEADEGEPLARAGTWRLVGAGLTGGRVGVGAAIVGFALQFLPEERVAEWLTVTNDEVPEFFALGGLRLLGAVAVVALLGGFLLSLAATVLAYWDFALDRSGDTLRVRRGLLTLHRDTVPFSRIQAVQVEENLPRRLLGFAAVRIIVAGRAGGGGGEGTDLILPLGRRAEAFRLAGRVAAHPSDRPPELEGQPSDAIPLQRMPKAARARRLARATIVVLLGGGAAAGGVAMSAGAAAGIPSSLSPGGTGLVTAAILGGAGMALALAAYRNLGWWSGTDHIAVREGVFTRVTTVVPLDRLQAVEISSNPFQRRRGLATLHLPIARPLRTRRAPRALDLGETEAESLLNDLSGRIRDLPWSGTPDHAARSR